MATKAYDATRSDYMTPPVMIEPILSFLGRNGFDIDVCCTKKNIPALYHFTKFIDGLKQSWAGKCFMNPPFKTAIKWVRKAVIEVALHDCEVWAVLPTNRTEVNYYQDNIFCNSNCVFGFLRGKQGFIIPGEEDKEPVPSIGIMIACFTNRPEEVEKKWNEQKLFGARAFRGGYENRLEFDI